jgi:transcription antitermination factor NusG
MMFFTPKEGVDHMHDFKVGDRVRILPGVATPFVGLDGTICAVRPHDEGVETMTKLFVLFSRNEKRAFYGTELMYIPREK